LEATKSMLCTDHSLHNNKVTQWYNTATLSMVDSWKPQRVKSTQFPFSLPSENIITPCQNSQVLAGYDIATCMILVYSSVYTY
jgi:translation elongation factor EF-1alpha